MSYKNTLFVVLSCDKYINTRVEGIKNSWGKNLNKLFLVDTSTNINELIGYDTPQTYDGIQDKYYNFFLNYDFTKYDYYFFVDDDTFVNLTEFNNLKLPNKDELYCIGRELHLNPNGSDKWGNNTGYPMQKIKGNNTNLPLVYPSGGAGFITTQKSCIEIQSYLKNIGDNKPISGHSDVTFGFWFRNIGGEFIPSQLFWWSTPDKLINNKWEKFTMSDEFITYHYVNESLMNFFNKKYNKDINQ